MMSPKRLAAAAALACAALVLALVPAAADDKKEDKAKPALKGTWAMKGGEMKMEFADKSVLKLFPHGDSVAMVLVCRYTAEKGDVVKAKVTGFEGEQEFTDKLKQLVPAGTEFQFKYRVKADTAKLEGVTGDKAERLQGHLEGEYERKK